MATVSRPNRRGLALPALLSAVLLATWPPALAGDVQGISPAASPTTKVAAAAIPAVNIPAAPIIAISGAPAATTYATSVIPAATTDASSGGSPSLMDQLRASLERLAAGHGGIVGISIRNLESGESISIRGHETFPSASLIKVAVMVALFHEVQEGRMQLDERTTMIARDGVGGSGILKHMRSGTSLTMEDAAWLMITLSDNTATNLILDKVDVRPVGVKMEALGLPHSKIHSKTFRRETSIAMDSSVVYGLGVTTPDETVELFGLLHEGKAVSPALDSLAIRILLANQDGTMLTRWLPPGTSVAHKSGTVDRARNDCGIMYTPAAPIAICVMTRENEETTYAVDNPAHLMIAAMARETFRHFNPEVPLPELPRF
jgi:beta-lactamase class A